MYDCIVIGGGPAGIMAAIKSAQNGGFVVILEKNQMLGRKLRITGKGRCNITNECDFDELIDNIPGNGKFLFSSFRKFSNYDLIDYLNSIGLPTVTERGNRVFPVSQKATDVANVLKKALEKAGVEVRYGYNVTDIVFDDEKKCVKGVYCDETFIAGKNVVIATGGVTYPGTGSTGAGYKLATLAGHTIIEPKPSLVGLVSSDKWISELEGLSLKNIGFIIKHHNGEKLYEDFGEMVFTSNGISGPVVLSGSRHVLKYDYKNVCAIIDFKPALSMEKLDERLTRDFDKYSRKHFNNSLGDLLPSKMIDVFAKLTGIPEDKFVNQITKQERYKIAELLKNFKIEIIRSNDISEAIVTAGGVKTSEINPKTMQSNIIKGLYFAGEVIDVDGYTGGFNLTIAFSTGVTAGSAIQKS